MAQKTPKTAKPTKTEKPVIELKEEELDETQGACASKNTGFPRQAKGIIVSLGR